MIASAARLASLGFCPPDDATGDTGAGVAGRLGFEIVRLGVDHSGTSDHRPLVVRERDLMVHVFERCLARRVSLHISHVAYMPFGYVGSRMRFIGWIKMSTSRARIGCAAIAELMDMKTMIAGSQASDFRPNLYAIGHFYEGNSTTDFVACGRMKHRDSFQGRRRLGLRVEAGR